MAVRHLGRVGLEWLGRADIQFTTHPSPVALEEKTTDGSTKTTTLLDVCRAATPPCQLNPLLLNGHIQTMWTAAKPHGPQIHYRRRIFHADHKTYRGTFAVDFVVTPSSSTSTAFSPTSSSPSGTTNSSTSSSSDCPNLPPRTTYLEDSEFAHLPSRDSRPMLVVLHGLSGGSHEVYLRHAIEPLVSGGAWEVCVVNSRGCAGSAITSGVLYNARATWDVRQVVRWLGENFPNRPLFGIGFSLGANIITNYVAEEGENCPLKAVISCSNPFNLEVSSKMLQSSLVGKEVYLRVMGAAMHNLISRHKKEIITHTNLDWEKIQTITYLNEFDREVQCATWGYPTEYAYYRDASSVDSVLSIRIPYLAINATDDPIAVNQGIPYEEFRKNPMTVLLTTSLGGHLSWFEPGGGRWYAKPVCNFLNHMAFNVKLEGIRPVVNGAPVNPACGAEYEPMRRRLQIIERD